MSIAEQIEKVVENAIAKSILENRTVDVEVIGDSGDVLAAIRQVDDCEVDYVFFDCEGVDTLDVWGFTDQDGDNTVWRLSVTFYATT